MNAQDRPDAAKKLTLKAWREGEGLSQTRLARELTALSVAVLGYPSSVTQQKLTNLENGLRPSRELVTLLAVRSRGRLDANAFYEIPDWVPFATRIEAVRRAA